jgi:AcrR family transcriptional regulator
MMDQSKYLGSNQRLFDETINEFCSKSFDYASLNEIVKRSEFNKGSFYYRFSDKLELYQAMIDIINSQHIVLYNQRLLDRMPDASSTDIAMEAIASLADLDQVDGRFSRMIERFAMETKDFQTQVITKCVPFVHLRVETELSLIQSRQKSDYYPEFVSLFQLYYFSYSLFQTKYTHLSAIRSSLRDVESKSSSKASNELHQSIHLNNTHFEPSGIHLMQLALIVGSRQSGKSTYARKTAQESAIQFNSVILVDGSNEQIVWFKATKTFKMSFKLLEAKARRSISSPNATSQATQIATFLRLSVKDRATDRGVLRHRWVFLWLLTQRIDTLILDDPMTQLSELEQTLIFNTLLKFRSRGVTMVLTSNPHPFLWRQCSHIAFLSSHGLSSFQPATELHAKYPADSVIVKYFENGTELRQLWNESAWKKPEFSMWLSTKSILEIQSIPMDFASVYKMETGEVLL